MAIKKLLVAAASIGLMTSPVLAAGPAPGTPVGGLEVAPASETVSGNQLEGSSWLLWGGLAVAAIILAIILLHDDDKDHPASP